MPTAAVAYGILKEFRTELIELRDTPFDGQGLISQLGTGAAAPVLRRMKAPSRQWFTKRSSPADLARLIELLDKLALRGLETQLSVQANTTAKVRELVGRRHYVGRWSEEQALELRRRILTHSSPYDLAADGIKAVSPIIPDWYWRLGAEAIEGEIPVSDQLYGNEARSFNYSRALTEALRRIGKRFGVKLHHNDACMWFEWLMGLEAHPWNDDQNRAQLCLNRLWWAEAVKLQARHPRPDVLPPVVPSYPHDFRDHPVSWIGDRPNTEYHPGVKIVCVDLGPTRSGLPVAGDTVELPRQLSGQILVTDYFEDGGGHVVRAILGVVCKER